MTELEIYYENLQEPWGKLFYRIIWEQLSFAKSMKILDFGSGFGVTANRLAIDNEVIAIEPNLQMCQMRFNDNPYNQINGGIERLSEIPNKTFDLIVCHNVLEYVDDKENYIAAFSRLLKAGGRLSLVKHNHLGRIMQRAVHDNDIESALKILDGESALAQNFGEVKYYDWVQINKWIADYGFKQVHDYGVRTFFGLSPDDAAKYNEDWCSAMFELEIKTCQMEEFRGISFFHHTLLEKI